MTGPLREKSYKISPVGTSYFVYRYTVIFNTLHI